MPRFIYVVLCLITTAVMLSACASDGKDGRPGTDLVPKEEAAMSTRGCLTCHTDYKDVVAASGHMTKDVDIPTNPTCTVCHSPDLGYLDIRTDDTFTGGVSCTGCHELNTEFKDNPIHSSYQLDSDKCVTCHKALSGHDKDANPYAKDVAADFGMIAESLSGHSNSSGLAIREGDPRACGLCHSSKVFANIANKVSPRVVTTVYGVANTYRTAGGAHEKLYANFAPYAETAKNLNLDRAGSDTVGCEGCHKPHSTELLSSPAMNGTTVVASAEFMLCTSCHIANVEIAGTTTKLDPRYVGTPDADGILPDADASLLAHHALDFTTANQNRTILDTHFAGELYSKYSVKDGKIKVENATVLPTIKGYNIRANAKNACTSCHNIHSGAIFEPKKDDKSYKAIAESWTGSKHAAQSRGSNCVPCHSAGRNYGYKLDNATITADNNYQISCFTCHTGDYERVDGAAVITGDNAKKLRIPKNAAEFGYVNAAYKDVVTQAVYDSIKAEYPADNVMLCATCHTGRRGTVAGMFKDATGTGNITIASGHQNESFGVISGLVFDLTTNLPTGKAYSSMMLAPHTAVLKEQGCTGCHITGTANHDFAVYTNAAKTNLLTTNTTCTSSCHGGGIADALGQNHRTQIIAVKAALAQLIPTTANTFVNLTIYPDADPANAEKRRKMGMAIGNLRILGTTNVDQGLHAHTTKKFLQELIYDSLFVLPDTGVVFNSNNVNFDNAKRMNTYNAQTALDKTHIDTLNAFFLNYTR